MSKTTKPVNALYPGVMYDSEIDIKDIKANSAKSMKIQIMEVPSKAVRLEGSGPLGIRVMSLVITQQGFSGVIYPEKKHVFGSSKRSLQSLIKVDLTAESLLYLLQDKMPSSDWLCKDEDARKRSCFSPDKSVQIETFNDGEMKEIKITSRGSQITWAIDLSKTKVQYKIETFLLPKPEGFKSVQIN